MSANDPPLRSCLKKKGQKRDKKRIANQKLRFHGEISFFTGDGELFLIPLPEVEEDFEATVDGTANDEKDSTAVADQTKAESESDSSKTQQDLKQPKKLKKKGSLLSLKGTFRLKKVKKLAKGGKKKHSKDLFLFSDTEVDATVRKKMKERVVSMDLGRPDWVDLEVEAEASASKGGADLGGADTLKKRGTLLRTGVFHGPVKLVKMPSESSAVESEMSCWLVLEEGPLMSFFCDELPTRDSLPVSCLVPKSVITNGEEIALAAGVSTPSVTVRACSDLDPQDTCVAILAVELNSDRENLLSALQQVLPKTPPQQPSTPEPSEKSALRRPAPATKKQRKPAFDCPTIRRPSGGSKSLLPVEQETATENDEEKPKLTSNQSSTPPSSPPTDRIEPNTPVQVADMSPSEASVDDHHDEDSAVVVEEVVVKPEPRQTAEVAKDPTVAVGANNVPTSPRQQTGLYDTSVAKWSKGPTPDAIQEEILSPRQMQEAVKDRQQLIDTSSAQWVKRKKEEAAESLKSPKRNGENGTVVVDDKGWQKTQAPSGLSQRDILSPRRARPTPAEEERKLLDTSGAKWKKFEGGGDDSDSEEEIGDKDVHRRTAVDKRTSKSSDRPAPTKPLPPRPPVGASKEEIVRERPQPSTGRPPTPEESPVGIAGQSEETKVSKTITETKGKFSVKKINLPKPLLGKPGPFLSDQLGKGQKAATLRSPQKSSTSTLQSATLRNPSAKPLPPPPTETTTKSPFAGVAKPLPAPPKPTSTPEQSQQNSNESGRLSRDLPPEVARKPLPSAPRGRGNGSPMISARGAAPGGRGRGVAKALPQKPDKNEIRRRLNLPKPLIGKAGSASVVDASQPLEQRKAVSSPNVAAIGQRRGTGPGSVHQPVGHSSAGQKDVKKPNGNKPLSQEEVPPVGAKPSDEQAPSFPSISERLAMFGK